MRSAIAADHNGASLKDHLIGWLTARGHDVDDRGTPFKGGRHQDRLDQVAALERGESLAPGSAAKHASVRDKEDGLDQP